MSWLSKAVLSALTFGFCLLPSALCSPEIDGRDAALQLTLQKTPIEVFPPPKHHYQLDPNWNPHAPPCERIFNWNISMIKGAPDGYVRDIIAVNVRVLSAYRCVPLSTILGSIPRTSHRSQP